MRNRIGFLVWPVIWLVLVMFAMRLLDPDFGWHIRMGEYISSDGIPATDPLSYTMSNFPFVDHEWLTNIGMWEIYRRWGMVALAIISSSVVTFALWISVPKVWRRWSLVPVLLTLSVILLRFGVRPQIEDWLLLIVTIRWFGEDGWWRKTRWLYPLLMLVWANLHGGYPLGIVGAGVVIAVRAWEQKRWPKKEILTWFLGITATFINPYGYRLWGEVVMQLTDKYARKAIAEWQPFYAVVEMGYVILWVSFAMLGWRARKTVGYWRLTVAGGLGLASLLSVRHTSLFMLVASAVLAGGWQGLYESVTDKVGKKRVELLYTLMVIISTIVVTVTGLISYVNTAPMREGRFYPREAIAYLKTHEIKGNLFADYGLGGYLNWKFPERKVFIDGRMATWKWKSPDPTQADYIFEDYLKITWNGEYEEVFEKFGVGTILWGKPNHFPWAERIIQTLEKAGFSYTARQSKLPFLKKLEEDGWKVVYEDNSGVIYEKGN